MRYAVDLHIHSALSPCSSDDMTPANIVNMAKLKGLNIIAVTDHNSAGNLKAFLSCGNQAGLTVVPGMEVETAEEVHLVCLFPDLEAALKMQGIVYAALPELKNREDIFGRQLLMDENDRILGSEERLLLTAAGLGVDQVYGIVNGLGGVTIPAHVDRESYGMISNLGMIPSHLAFKYLELSAHCDRSLFLEKNKGMEEFCFIKSSDAHDLGGILERDMFLELKEPGIRCLLEELKYKK